LREVLEKHFGAVSRLNLPPPEHQKNKNFSACFVSFEDPEVAKRILAMGREIQLEGQVITVAPLK